ncbi:bifunctional copper resistance protein CopD/cytochrome c oxidase assembly protein [Actinocorallia sp. API 0066]|uniref:cytochrome c oxidase assembly protein n=1 Tax=Actinocorallia sp. API 0066 TaxID=2896846 RepID=UPI001E5C6813|nr:cytochrome c oxidase assembly protein [Actinocorallia sp. API 0066]MCD0451048.1 bifunctional copper resistance protein CopD/cytochrome c oxidase assembly protein [Actinocorallia sp. API 0066]
MRSAYRAAAVASLAAVLGLVAALYAGGSLAEKVIPGIGDAGDLVRWGLPVARTVMDLSAALTVGCLVMAVVLLPLIRDGLTTAATTYLRAASWCAAVWACAAGATLVFTVADILGVSVGGLLRGNELSSYVGQLPQGTALLLVILATVVIALLGRTVDTPAAALGLLFLAFVALLPPALTGHSASSPNHSVAMIGLALHLASVVPWVGGLAVLTWHALTKGRLLETAASRFSRLALWCAIVVGLSGLASTISRLPDPVQLVETDYGRLLLAKMAAFAVLVWIGWRHREWTVPMIADRKPLAFTRLAVVEAAIMAATMGLAVALAQTAPPVTSLEAESSVKALLGYEMPPPLNVERLATLWRFDLFWVVLVAALVGFYAAAVVRLRRRGDGWPWYRTVFWLLGAFSVAVATLSGVATYAPTMFSVHMSQHMVIAMISPIFLVLGAPVTLALRALKPAKVRGDRGPREWLTAFLHSKYTAVVAHPAVATLIFMGSTWALYYSPAFEWLMGSHLGHIAMLAHFLLSGYLFYWVIIGVDPSPRPIGYPWRLLLLFVTMPFHAFLGLSLMNMGEPLAADWYKVVYPPWAGPLVDDIQNGGAIAWGFGEIPTFIVLLAIVGQWAVSEGRRARRTDRRADRDEDAELTRYNEMLSGLNKGQD